MYQQDLWHYTIAAWWTPASQRHPRLLRALRRIKDTVACEDQFRNAFLLGCVGVWSLHPVQIDIAKRCSPRPDDVAHAREVVDAMGDGTGAVCSMGRWRTTPRSSSAR